MYFTKLFGIFFIVLKKQLALICLLRNSYIRNAKIGVSLAISVDFLIK